MDHVKLHITTLGAAGTVKDAQPALKRLSVGTASGADQESAKTTHIRLWAQLPRTTAVKWATTAI